LGTGGTIHLYPYFVLLMQIFTAKSTKEAVFVLLKLSVYLHYSIFTIKLTPYNYVQTV